MRQATAEDDRRPDGGAGSLAAGGARRGHYALGAEIASGGLGAVHLGVDLEARRVVALKRLYPHVVRDSELSTMLLDEARVASRVKHPHVVSTWDVVSDAGELLLPMEYVHGPSLAELLRAAAARGSRVPPSVVVAIVAGVLEGLQRAHEANGEDGAPLHLVHRDVSPQNILVASDGVSKITDFGVAKARGRAHSTRDGTIKGKLAYMAPEQACGDPVDARTDVFAAGVVLWEALTGRPLFMAATEAATLSNVMGAPVQRPSVYAGEAQPLDRAVLMALEREPRARHPSARELARALCAALPPAPPAEVARCVERLWGPELAARAQQLRELEALVAPEPAPEPPSAARPVRPPLQPRGARRAVAPRVLAAVAAGCLAQVVAGVLVVVSVARLPSGPAAAPPNVRAEGAPSGSIAPSGGVGADGDLAGGEAPARGSSAAAPAPSAGTAATASAATTAPVARPARGVRKGDCSPPYVVDAHGRRLFKKECL